MTAVLMDFSVGDRCSWTDADIALLVSRRRQRVAVHSSTRRGSFFAFAASDR